MTLEQLGWSSFWQDAFAVHVHQTPGRVATSNRGIFTVITAEGEVEARIAGRLRHHANRLADYPVTGDWVALSEGNVIECVLTRRSKISRKQPGRETEEQILAANVDIAILVSGLDADFNLRRLERYLSLAWESGARPLIVLNKADLCPDLGGALNAAESIAAGAPVVAMSALDPAGPAKLEAHVQPGETAALLGSSGVGKSTITNRIAGASSQAVRAVRDWDNRGRHTTTQRELVLMPGGWLLIDMPGLREIQLWADASGLDHSFGEVAEFAAACRFRDCSHQGEPGCAVIGNVSEDRLANYHKLRRELEYLERKEDVRAAAEHKRKWKLIHKQMRKLGK